MARRIRRTTGPLGTRAQAILRAVIEEYVATATPVGSHALVDRYRLDVSSATVRGILAELEASGLLAHPHTSAGRVPTDAGYRFYVESLMAAAPLPQVQQLMIRHQFGQVEFLSEQWSRLAATTLAATTHAAGLATPAKPPAARIRRIDLIPIGGRNASLILVLHEGAIKQAFVTLDESLDVEALAAVASWLNEVCQGRTADEVEGQLGRLVGDDPLTALKQRAAERIVQTLRGFDAAAIEDLFSDGLLNVMAAPEFAQSDKLRRVFTALENRAYLGRLFAAVTEADTVRVFIGHENAAAEMMDVSLIVAPYGRRGRAVGVVGVLGPTRMSYAQAIGNVTFVSGLMNELVDHLYA